jgi:hypothetical protein
MLAIEPVSNKTESGNEKEEIAIITSLNKSQQQVKAIVLYKEAKLSPNPMERLPTLPKADELLQMIGEDTFKQGREGRTANSKRIKTIIESLLLSQTQQLQKPQKDALVARAIDKLKDTVGREIFVQNIGFKVIPLPIVAKNFRECLFIVGPSGSGKSTYSAVYIMMWCEAFPDRKKHPIYVFSRVGEDPAIDKIPGVRRIIIDSKMVTNPITTEQLEGSLVLFDDIDTLPSSKRSRQQDDDEEKITDQSIKEAVCNLRDDLLETGRHRTVYVICTSHKMTNWKSTRTCLNEATSVTFFPHCGSIFGIKRYLNVYAELDKKQVSKIMSLPSRWVTYYPSYPQRVIHEHGAYLV